MRQSILLSCFFIFLQSAVNAQAGPCSFTCKRLTLAAYKPGMVFYFPADKAPSLNAVFGPRFIGASSYNDLAGKKYVIRDMDNFRDLLYYDRMPPDNGKPSNDRIQNRYSFTMMNVVDKNDTFSYEISVDPAAFLPSAPYPSLNNDAFIAGAIAYDEFEASKKWLLQLPDLYSLFAIGGKKYEKVKIKNVIPGHPENPIGIVYSSASATDTVYVNLCGTNVAGAYIEAFHFNKYFTCENKQGKIPIEKWELIRAGKPDLDMNAEEALLTLGKPKKVEETTMRDAVKTVYTFDRYVLAFENGKMVRVESTK
ncbi:hypothetical protein [Pseudobacter ginsenosidimutans]|uniref:DKNYY family protein n=1 Tax=Pseudobacter ginsenosidimutans TaxID=661488 RepID=A0A4Q7N0H2_9BACT|nr:hypothetical protein [Pseudobacter ginsenosidimutans]QEC43289.1 hypothetical protein FSB84_16885 [Pseudobacter ginsenosidimutans]RZS74652.1 hypothetical protein EV199_0501 [Pseudobacter ginsenosidimutans]